MISAATTLRAASEGAGGLDTVTVLTLLGSLILSAGGIGTFLAGRAASRRFVPDTYKDAVVTLQAQVGVFARERDQLVVRLDTTEAEKAAVERERDEWREKYFAALRHPSYIQPAEESRHAAPPPTPAT